VDEAPCPVFSLDDAELVPRLADLVEREVMLGGPGADTLGRPDANGEAG
jgi:hypothetical protein